MSKQLTAIRKDLHACADPKKAASSMRFFKTGKGEYAEGDVFLGLTVPETRAIVGTYWKDMSLPDTERLLHGKFHEKRLAALHILVLKFRYAQKAQDGSQAKKIFMLYTKNTAYINNWDLVDTSASTIVGDYIGAYMDSRQRLTFVDQYCASRDLWKNRIIILASYAEIRKGNERLNFYIARKLMHHKHDLIHKALGWMLREVGKRVGKTTLEIFLDEHAHEMPRTMLRYALEHFSVSRRAYYMTKG